MRYILKPNLAILIGLVLLCLQVSLAEGTKEVAPNASIIINGSNTNDIAALLINHDSYGQFASYSNDDDFARLYINIQDPFNECIYFGLSPATNNHGTNVATYYEYEYRIVDPNGNIVYGPFVVSATNGNISNHAEATLGPQQIVGAGGYNAIQVTSNDLTSAGNFSAGDYYIEFANNANPENEMLFDYWDFTVANCSTPNPVSKPGRVWSYKWALFAINDFGFPQRPFNGSFYVCAPDTDNTDLAFVTKIDFGNSRFRPAAFNVAFNSFGLVNTGNIATDRQSQEDINQATGQYPIYLNDPIELCQEAIPGQVSLEGIGRCGQEDYCISVLASKAGQIDMLLDFDLGDGIYTPNSADIMLSRMITPDEVDTAICIYWDGYDGNGVFLGNSAGANIPVVLFYQQGVYHFPVYDAEFMIAGFKVEAIRPAGDNPLLFYDDTQISLLSGSGEPRMNLNGCVSPCHTWTNYTTGNTIGFGNLNTINTWWFSQRVMVAEVLTNPSFVTCNIIGPAEICDGDSMELTVELAFSPDNGMTPTLDQISWSGPNVTGTTNTLTVPIVTSGTYEALISYASDVGTSCLTSCNIEVLPKTDCCSPDIACQPIDSIFMNCMLDLPAPYQSLDDLVAIGFVLIDQECANYLFILEETQSGDICGPTGITVKRNYRVFDDSNDNGLYDAGELSAACDQIFVAIDAVGPTIKYNPQPGFPDVNSGDTIVFQCLASDPNWTIPQFGPENVTVIEGCSSELTFTDNSFESLQCDVDHFLRFYECSWKAIDDCGRSDELILYMKLIDTIPPVISAMPDLTVNCPEEIQFSVPEINDLCDCTFKNEQIDTINFICESNYQLRHRIEAKDCCGNKSQSDQIITVKDISTPEFHSLIPQLREVSNGMTLEVECDNGQLPMWMYGLTDQSVSLISKCATTDLTFETKIIEYANCNFQDYLELHEFKWTGSNACNQGVAEFVFYVRVVDHTAPSLTISNIDPCSSFSPIDAVIVTDNCQIADIQIDSIQLDQCIGITPIEYTWTATDACGNSESISRVVRTGDTLAPFFRLTVPTYGIVKDGDTLVVSCNKWDNGNYLNLLQQNYLYTTDYCFGTVQTLWNINPQSEISCGTLITQHHKVNAIFIDGCENTTNFEFFVSVENVGLAYTKELSLSCLSELPVLDLSQNCQLSQFTTRTEIDDFDCNKINYGLRIIDWTDICGTDHIDTQRIMFDDKIAPTFAPHDKYYCKGDVRPSLSASDNCSDIAITLESQIESCNGNWTTFTYQATDACGNSSRTELVEIGDEGTGITIYHPKYGELFDGDTLILPCTFQPSEIEVRFDDVCSIDDVQKNILSERTLECDRTTYVGEVVLEIENSVGCQGSDMATLTILLRDHDDPIIHNPPGDLILGCDDALEVPSLDVEDYCSIPFINYTLQTDILPNSDTLYTQTWVATDACGREANHSREIIKYRELTCDIIAPDTINCLQSVLVDGIALGGDGLYTYNWRIAKGDCEIIRANRMNSQIYITLLSSEETTIELEVVDNNGCHSICSVTVVCDDKPIQPITSSDRIEENKTVCQKEDILLYPNPVGNVAFLRPINRESELTGLKVYDMQGRLVLMQKVIQGEGNEVRLDLSEIDNGLYIIEIRTTHNKMIKKFEKLEL